MTGFFTAVLAVGVILGFMILIHEFGHYAVAKLLGVRVEQFAIGFGKRLVGFRRAIPTIASTHCRSAVT
jgi:regulator of sigma E protease